MSKILILGAGASKGSALNASHRPPTTCEFFSHPLASVILPYYTPLLNYLDRLGIETLAPPFDDIEVLLDHIDSTWELVVFSANEILERYGLPFLGVTPTQMIMSYIVDILTAATRSLMESTCTYHDSLMKSWIEAGDCIVSFNYDLIADFSLKNTREWDELNGYGFYAHNHRGESSIKSDVHLLKPHGSLNWRGKLPPPIASEAKEFEFLNHQHINVETVEDCLAIGHASNPLGTDLPNYAPRIIDFVESMFERNDREHIRYDLVAEQIKSSFFGIDDHYPLIVLPKRNKNYMKMKFGELGNIWKKILTDLENCDEILVCGFSFNDIHFNQILIESCINRDNTLKINLIDLDDGPESMLAKILKGRDIEIEHVASTLEEYVMDKSLLP